MRIISIFLFTLALAASSFAQQNLKPGSTAPVFTAASMDGKTVDLNRLQGKIVVLTFWSTKCEICHAEIPKLNRIAARYKDQNVVFIGLTMENEAKVAAYLKRTPFNFDIVPNSFGMVMQYADRDRQGNINMGFPAHFLVDQSGAIELKTSGFDKSAELESRITRLIARGNSAASSAAAGGK
jgi:peroxiredoxin